MAVSRGLACVPAGSRSSAREVAHGVVAGILGLEQVANLDGDRAGAVEGQTRRNDDRNTMTINTSRIPREVGYFFAWAVAGAGLIVAFLTPFTIGIPAALVGATVIALLVWRRRLGRSSAGLLPGVGFILIYIAYLNRGGPGTVCTTTASSQQCISEYSPWPWLVIGILFIVSGLVVFLARPGGISRSR